LTISNTLYPIYFSLQDSFGARALAAGIPAATLKEWSVDPQVKGKSVFDQLEDLDAADCLAKMVELAN
jgi:capsid protein